MQLVKCTFAYVHFYTSNKVWNDVMNALGYFKLIRVGIHIILLRNMIATRPAIAYPRMESKLILVSTQILP